jgi:hypothetical protein
MVHGYAAIAATAATPQACAQITPGLGGSSCGCFLERFEKNRQISAKTLKANVLHFVFCFLPAYGFGAPRGSRGKTESGLMHCADGWYQERKKKKGCLLESSSSVASSSKAVNSPRISQLQKKKPLFVNAPRALGACCTFNPTKCPLGSIRYGSGLA